MEECDGVEERWPLECRSVVQIILSECLVSPSHAGSNSLRRLVRELDGHLKETLEKKRDSRESALHCRCAFFSASLTYNRKVVVDFGGYPQAESILIAREQKKNRETRVRALYL